VQEEDAELQEISGHWRMPSTLEANAEGIPIGVTWQGLHSIAGSEHCQNQDSTYKSCELSPKKNQKNQDIETKHNRRILTICQDELLLNSIAIPLDTSEIAPVTPRSYPLPFEGVFCDDPVPNKPKLSL
jgi:hypothetical protein